MLLGSMPAAALIAACTSRQAPSMSRLKSNCKVIWVEPCELLEVISVTPAIRPNARSNGVATVAAMVSALAPGNCACTDTVGKSTCGSDDTGKFRNANMPHSEIATVSSVVATGRRMNRVDKFIAIRRRFRLCRRRQRRMRF